MSSLNNKIEQMLHDNSKDFEIAKVIKKDIENYFDTLPEIFSKSGGKDFLVKHTHKIDNITKLVYKIAQRTMFEKYLPLKQSLPICILALGSYGREQLCVHSDIDIMIAYKDIPGYNTKEFIEKMLYTFWDAGLKIGHRVHELSELPEVAKSDITIKSAILESRFIEGSKFLWTDIENKIHEIRKDDPTKFIKEKLDEQKLLHKKFPLTMEPNLKEGFGGFRNANLVFWIGKLLHNAPRIKDLPSNIINEGDYRQFRIALEFLFRVRSALHLVSGKKEDRLRMDRIPEVANLLGYDNTAHAHMRFAKKTTECLRIINLYTKIWLEELIAEYTPEIYEKLLKPSRSYKNLADTIKYLNRQADSPFEPHPRLLKTLISAKKPDRLDNNMYKAIGEIFDRNASHSVLKTLHEARLLKYAMPPIKKVVDLPQFDGYHNYSVDVHLLSCLWHLENIADAFLADLYDTLSRKEKHLLKIVTFLHDAGKGRIKDHSLVGVSLFRIFAKKIKLGKEMTDIGIRLIQYHDLMSITAQREDLHSEKTILQFASRFNSKKLLDMIYLLTYADMSGVGEGVYSNFKAKLLRMLYMESLEALKHDKILNTTAKKLKKLDSLRRSRSFRSLPRSLQKKVLSIPSNELFLYNSVERILSIIDMAENIDKFKYKITNRNFLTIEIVRKESLNLGYLLSKLSRLNVVNMEIAKLFDGMKYFKIDFDDIVDDGEIPLIEKIITSALTKTIESHPSKPIILKDEIEIDCEHSREYGIMRLRTKDQKGLLAYVMQLFDRLHIDIVSTKIHTSKHRANDLFLIQKDGNFCNNTDIIIKELTE